MKKQANKFHGNQVAKSINLTSLQSTNNAWRKVSKAGNFSNWMDYQKWVLAQVKPVEKYKKDIIK